MSERGKPYNVGDIIKRQGRSFVKEFDLDGVRHMIDIRARFDDECGNGHETFSLTADYWEKGKSKERTGGGGCCHEIIVQAMPELAPLVKWHLCSTDGPLHYEANTIYLAGDRDYNGRPKGEPSSFRRFISFGDFPRHFPIKKTFADWLELNRADLNGGRLSVLAVPHINRAGDTYDYGPKYTLNGPRGHYGEKWHECPFDTEHEALEFLEAIAWCKGEWGIVSRAVSWSDGKERELDAARRCAIWPEATDAELMQEPEALRAALRERLPALLADFREAMTSDPLGFEWPARLADVGGRS